MFSTNARQVYTGLIFVKKITTTLQSLIHGIYFDGHSSSRASLIIDNLTFDTLLNFESRSEIKETNKLLLTKGYLYRLQAIATLE